MKKRNKLIALLLAMTMCSSILAGCGSSNDEKSSEAKQSTDSVSAQQSESVSTQTSAEEVKELLKNVDIYPLDCDKTFTAYSQHASLADGSSVATQRMEEATGVKIQWTQMTSEQFGLALAGKEFPDILWGMSIDKETAYEYGDAGYFVNFMDYIDIMPNFKAAIEANPGMLELAQNDDGSVYSLPTKVITNTAQSNILYYRTDMMKEIGWEAPPATTDEFIKYIKELQAHYGAKDPEYIAFSGYGKSYIAWTGDYFPAYFFAAFGPLLKTTITVDPDGNVVLGAATEQWKHYLEFMREVWESGAFDTNMYTLETSASQAKAAANQVGVTAAHNGHSYEQFKSGNFDLDVLPPLTSEYWDTPHWYMKNGESIGLGYLISAKCEDIEAAVKWFDAWYSTADNPLDEEGSYYSITPWLGKIGTDFALDDTDMVYNELEHEGIEKGKFQGKETFSSPIYTGYEDTRFPYSAAKNTNLWVKGSGIQNNLWPYGETTFELTSLQLSPEDADTYATIYSDLWNFIGQWTSQFISGERSIADDWDDYLAELEKIGLSKACAIYQAAYDAQK